MTHLWLLQVREDAPGPSYDVACGFIVEAATEKDAREMAASESGDEGSRAWIDPTLSTCELLKLTGRPGIILRDFNAG
jgi:hypothetical protein